MSLKSLSLAIPVVGGFACAPSIHAAPEVDTKQASVQESYPYGGKVFSSFIADSYGENPSKNLKPFYRWFADAYGSAHRTLGGQPTLAAELKWRHERIKRAKPGPAKVAVERETAAWLHRLIKTTIPRFSLDRGFEFTNTVKLGERQCFLQAVLLAGLAQEMGMDAGVVMVWKNEKGVESNNGHAVAILKLANGRDLLDDASDPAPFMRHQGLFVADRARRSYRFVSPVYEQDSTISSFDTPDRKRLTVAQVRPLDTGFLKSQFYYYRGERASGGFMGSPKTKEGLASSARFLEAAERACPQNPLAVYVLGHVYARQGLPDRAKQQYAKGYALYTAFGHVPDGPKAAMRG